MSIITFKSEISLQEHEDNSLLNNDYPIDFIFNINSLKMLFYKLRAKGNNVDSDAINEERPPWFILPYIPLMSEKFFITMKIDYKH